MIDIKKDFVVFILTHGRANNMITVPSLARAGYTGDIVYIVDNEDKQQEEYKRLYGDSVYIFDKKAEADLIDEGNNFDERRTITHARNVCFKAAKELGYKYFIELDDDYTSFSYRTLEKSKSIRNLDKIFEIFLTFLKNTNANTIALSQGGDHIGGFSGDRMMRKAMNSFMFSVDDDVRFVGAMNEDVNTYTTLGSRGKLFFTLSNVQLNQKATQSQASGITDMYQSYGTYVKSMTTVMMMPSAVKVTMMTSKFERLHHRISWRNTSPCIIREEYKKKKDE